LVGFTTPQTETTTQYPENTLNLMGSQGDFYRSISAVFCYLSFEMLNLSQNSRTEDFRKKQTESRCEIFSKRADAGN
jgi:hypothetical protein